MLMQSFAFSIHESMALTSSDASVDVTMSIHDEVATQLDDHHGSDLAEVQCTEDNVHSADECCADYCSFSNFVLGHPSVGFWGGASDFAAMEQLTLVPFSHLSLQRPPRI